MRKRILPRLSKFFLISLSTIPRPLEAQTGSLALLVLREVKLFNDLDCDVLEHYAWEIEVDDNCSLVE
jgi:hypothetical protein